jgi:microcompartment protein CcmL/EutN
MSNDRAGHIPLASCATPLLRVDGPAWAMLELSSISRGFVVADAMVKQATVQLERAEAVTPGKFLILVTGGEEEVDQALTRGRELAEHTIIDELRLTSAHPQLAPALRGALECWNVPGLAVVETFSVAAAISAADRALKAAHVWLLRLRLARGLGGKAFFFCSAES